MTTDRRDHDTIPTDYGDIDCDADRPLVNPPNEGRVNWPAVVLWFIVIGFVGACGFLVYSVLRLIGVLS